MNYPQSALKHVEFCDFAREAWARLRTGLSLPAVDPSFVWEDVQPEVIGTTIMNQQREPVTLTHQSYAEFIPSIFDSQIEKLATDVLWRSGGVPEVYGRLPIPQSIYYSVLLVSGMDTFAVRLLHDEKLHSDVRGWLSRADVLHSFARGASKR